MKKCKAKPRLVDISPIPHPVKGAAGHLVKLGRVMSCEPYVSPKLGVTVPRRTGKVVRVYYRDYQPEVLVDLQRGSTVYTVEAWRLKRSQAAIEEA